MGPKLNVAGSIGFQLGLQQKSQVILFMNQKELDKFQKSDGWKAGVDGSVALATLGADVREHLSMAATLLAELRPARPARVSPQ